MKGNDFERAELYRLFAELFMKAPSEDVAGKIRDIFQVEFDDSIKEIQEDSARVVLTTTAHYAPYESLFNVSVGDKPRLPGKASQEVQAFYVSTGVMIDKETGLLPDHIAAELLFMCFLVENGFIERQVSFMEEHLHRWVPDYCGELEKHASTAFYKEIANLLREFILSEYEELSVL